MIPLHDTNPTRGTPIVTRVLIGVNILVWLYIFSISRDNAALGAFFDRYAFDWGEFTRAVTGGQLTLDTFIPLFTHMFLHAGWLHVGSNMLFLWIFGDNVEHRMGAVAYLCFYLVAGLIASLAQVFVNGNSTIPSLGASGAISGVLGAYLVLFPRNRVTVFLLRFLVVVPAIVAIGLWAVFQFVNGLGSVAVTAETDGVAYMAHIGGFVTGIVAGFLVATIAPRRRRTDRYA